MYNSIILDVVTTATNNDWVAPTVTGVFSVITAVIAVVSVMFNRKRGNLEQRAPDVQEIWIRQELDRRSRQVMEDMWWDLRGAFKSYFRRVSSAVLLLNLDEKQAKVFSLTTVEKAAIDATPPEEPSPSVTSK